MEYAYKLRQPHRYTWSIEDLTSQSKKKKKSLCIIIYPSIYPSSIYLSIIYQPIYLSYFAYVQYTYFKS